MRVQVKWKAMLFDRESTSWGGGGRKREKRSFLCKAEWIKEIVKKRREETDCVYKVFFFFFIWIRYVGSITFNVSKILTVTLSSEIGTEEINKTFLSNLLPFLISAVILLSSPFLPFLHFLRHQLFILFVCFLHVHWKSFALYILNTTTLSVLPKRLGK